MINIETLIEMLRILLIGFIHITSGLIILLMVYTLYWVVVIVQEEKELRKNNRGK